jgi:hypothetical protein
MTREEELEAILARHRKPEADSKTEGKPNGGAQEQAGERAKEQASQTAREPVLPLEIWDAGDDPGPIPPREWLLGNQFCREFISSIVAVGGTGKTALRLLQFISLATGRELTGQHVFCRCRVLLLSLEDGRNELQRRLAAVLKHYGIPRLELKGWLICSTPTQLTKLAEMNGRRQRDIGPLYRQVCNAIEQIKPDIVGLDPFIKTHALEENSNGDMNFVCDLLARIAVDHNIAVDSPHHTHKGLMAPGDADAGRGASGIRDAGRLVYTLTPMSPEEARTFDIEADKRLDYVRLDPAKVNIVTRSTKATWFRLISVPIDNATERYPNGDSVQTVEPWSPPETWADTSIEVLNRVLDDLAAGPTPTERYSSAPKAGEERAAWRVVRKHCPDKPEGNCRAIINIWLREGVLHETQYKSPKTRKEVGGLEVINDKRPGTDLYETRL